MLDSIQMAIWTIAAVVVVEVHARRRGDLDRYARRMGLAVPDERRAELAATLAGLERSTRRDGLTAAAVGLLIGVPLVVVGLSGALGGVMVMWASTLGVCLATRAEVATIDQSSAAPDVRVARTVDLRGDDLSTAWERAVVLLAPVVIVLAAAMLLVVRVMAPGATQADLTLVVGAGVAALAALAACLVLRRAERRLVAAPEMASDEPELAWLDALRASAVRDLRGAVGAVAVISSALTLGLAGWILLRVPPGTTDDPELTRLLVVVVLVSVIVLWAPLVIAEQVGRRTANPAAPLKAAQN